VTTVDLDYIAKLMRGIGANERERRQAVRLVRLEMDEPYSTEEVARETFAPATKRARRLRTRFDGQCCQSIGATCSPLFPLASSFLRFRVGRTGVPAFLLGRIARLWLTALRLIRI